MEEIKKIIEERDLKSHPGGENLINRQTFLEVIPLLKEKGLGLGGFDGFHLRVGGIQIDQDYSPSFSSLLKEESLQKAKEFLDNHLEEDIGYELVIRP